MEEGADKESINSEDNLIQTSRQENPTEENMAEDQQKSKEKVEDKPDVEVSNDPAPESKAEVGNNNTHKQKPEVGNNNTHKQKPEVGNNNTRKQKPEEDIILVNMEESQTETNQNDTKEKEKAENGRLMGMKTKILTAFSGGRSKEKEEDNVTTKDVEVSFDLNSKESKGRSSRKEKDLVKRIRDVEEGVFSVTKEDLERKKDRKSEEDEVDSASVWSYFMPKKNFQYYFQHPYLRLFIVYFVTFCNFLIYAEDPVAHSMKECTIPLVGNDFAFVATRYAPNAWSLLKVFLWLVAILIGILLGKFLVHGLFFNRVCRLKMFEDDMGSFMVIFLTTLIVLFIFSWIYNLFLLIGGSDTDNYRISDLMGVSNSIFMKMAATGTWCGDFFTAWMVTDMMLQEKLYPLWAVGARRWWNTGYRRIILFWTITTLATFIVILVIATDYIQWDKLNRDFLHSNEVSRAFLASFILVMDILIVLQDWDFPHFVSAIDIKLPGVNTAHIKFNIPTCLKREVWKVHITGKWFNYGILFLVMILDLNMWKNQIFYGPFDYGQYTDSDGKIHSVTDEYSLKTFNESQLSYSYRSVTINPVTNTTYLTGDTVMNARYNGYHLAIKLIALIPSFAAFLTFGILLWKFGRRVPHDRDVYAGRLKKRRRDGNKVKFNKFRGFAAMVRAFKLRPKVNDNRPDLVSYEMTNSSNAENSHDSAS
ncbi:transmembrane protein 117-like isoform X2 [Ostrea edulis]|nr:transmembrane protein 117-like isoform X2 [Ostrea edulis]XP_048780172.2 transmembrane protein 117-like isoform X2 [Ostrea edulis]XP_048780173.2 transmembrane protein 117-like isoform X2 [Ostrea edulis]XP_048780174.2 transmembrane protein 117-like isoform X2 [Ostrea edulis]XP_048780175.2 transmembrane protein 117-like isoform X2 [Ostrea edulis]XP_048780176.2 transmembrane protein 117-like isoform X2 [Ostrea edulis]